MVAEPTDKSLRVLGCRKGSRTCIYPEPRLDTKPNPSKMQRQSRSASSNTRRAPISPLHDHTWPSVARVVESKETSFSPSTDNSSVLFATQSISPGLDQSKKFRSVSTVTSQKASPWFHLAPKLQYHLEYHQHLSYNYYFLGHDSSNFIHNTLVEHAISYKRLLYAIVGFAAFLEILQNCKGKIQAFLGYYDKSIMLLRKSLSERQKHTHATLLTILQLATFEVRRSYTLLEDELKAYRSTLAIGSTY